MDDSNHLLFEIIAERRRNGIESVLVESFGDQVTVAPQLKNLTALNRRLLHMSEL